MCNFSTDRKKNNNGLFKIINNNLKSESYIELFNENTRSKYWTLFTMTQKVILQKFKAYVEYKIS